MIVAIVACPECGEEPGETWDCGTCDRFDRMRCDEKDLEYERDLDGACSLVARWYEDRIRRWWKEKGTDPLLVVYALTFLYLMCGSGAMGAALCDEDLLAEILTDLQPQIERWVRAGCPYPLSMNRGNALVRRVEHYMQDLDRAQRAWWERQIRLPYDLRRKRGSSCEGYTLRQLEVLNGNWLDAP